MIDDLDLCWDDDSVDTPEVMMAQFVMTDGDQGMTAEDAARALRILDEPPKLPLPLPRREGEVLVTPATDVLVGST